MKKGTLFSIAGVVVALVGYFAFQEATTLKYLLLSIGLALALIGSIINRRNS